MRPLGPLPRWLERAEVSAAWRLKQVRQRVVCIFASVGAVGCLRVLVESLSTTGGISAHNLAILGTSLTFMTSAFVLCRSRHLGAPAFEALELATWLIGVTALSVGAATVESSFERHGTFLVVLFWGFVGPVFLWMRLRVFVPYAVVACIVQTVLHLHADKDMPRDDHGRSSGHVTWTNLSTAILFVVLAYGQGAIVHTLERIYTASKWEQEAPALCDAWCKLDRDGAVVLQADGRFDALLGVPAAGTCIATWVGNGTAADTSCEDLKVLRRLLREAANAKVLSPKDAATVPITLHDSQGHCIKVRAFAALSSPWFADPELGAGYWLGLRRICAAASTHRTDGGSASSRLHEMLNSPPVIPVTFFTDLNEPRLELKVELTAEELAESMANESSSLSADCFRLTQEKGLSSTLAEMRALGEQEHWLIAPEEVLLYRNGCIGAGAFASVVTGNVHGAPVVVKLLKQSGKRPTTNSAVQSLCSELRVLRHLRHPNLVHFKGAVCDVTRQQLGLIIERIAGGDVDVWMTTQPHEAQRYRIMVGVCRGLWHLHAHRPTILHGDLKSQNVLVERGGFDVKAKLADFGLSVLQTLDLTACQRGGTLRWMPPEAFQRKVPAMAGADMFSNGRLMEFLALGRPPLEDVSAEELKLRLRADVVDLPAWPAELTPLQRSCKPLVEACLKVDWTSRPSAQQLHSLLVTMPTEPFDDDRRAAARIAGEGMDLIPWCEAFRRRAPADEPDEPESAPAPGRHKATL